MGRTGQNQNFRRKEQTFLKLNIEDFILNFSVGLKNVPRIGIDIKKSVVKFKLKGRNNKNKKSLNNAEEENWERCPKYSISLFSKLDPAPLKDFLHCLFLMSSLNTPSLHFSSSPTRHLNTEQVETSFAH